MASSSKRPTYTETDLRGLPEDIQLKIFSMLDPRSMVRVAVAAGWCAGFKMALQDPAVKARVDLRVARQPAFAHADMMQWVMEDAFDRARRTMQHVRDCMDREGPDQLCESFWEEWGSKDTKFYTGMLDKIGQAIEEAQMEFLRCPEDIDACSRCQEAYKAWEQNQDSDVYKCIMPDFPEGLLNDECW